MSCSDDYIHPSLGNTSVFKKYDTSASGQDGVTGTGITLRPETTKNLEKIYETAVFKILDDRQERTVILERQETNEVSLAVAPAQCLEKVSRTGGREGESRWSLVSTLCCGNAAGNVGRLKWPAFLGQRTEEERAVHSFRNM